jgi:hypothetical protein
MVAEVTKYGNSLCLARRGNASNSVQASDLVFSETTFLASDPSRRPYGWLELRGKRIYAREQVDRRAGVPEEKLKASRSTREKQEEAAMVEEVTIYGFALNKNEPVQAADIIIDAKTFDPKNPSKRPLGWSELRTKRVLMAEAVDRRSGAADSDIIESRTSRERQEENAMIAEAQAYGALLGIAGPADDAYRVQPDLDYGDKAFDAKNPSKRPTGWAELRIRRVLAKEQVSRALGISEANILQQRPNSILEVSLISIFMVV